MIEETPEWAAIAATRQGLYRTFGRALLPPDPGLTETLRAAAEYLEEQDLTRFAFYPQWLAFRGALIEVPSDEELAVMYGPPHPLISRHTETRAMKGDSCGRGGEKPPQPVGPLSSRRPQHLAEGVAAPNRPLQKGCQPIREPTATNDAMSAQEAAQGATPGLAHLCNGPWAKLWILALDLGEDPTLGVDLPNSHILEVLTDNQIEELAKPHQYNKKGRQHELDRCSGRRPWSRCRREVSDLVVRSCAALDDNCRALRKVASGGSPPLTQPGTLVQAEAGGGQRLRGAQHRGWPAWRSAHATASVIRGPATA